MVGSRWAVATDGLKKDLSKAWSGKRLQPRCRQKPALLALVIVVPGDRQLLFARLTLTRLSERHKRIVRQPRSLSEQFFSSSDVLRLDRGGRNISHLAHPSRTKIIACLLLYYVDSPSSSVFARLSVPSFALSAEGAVWQVRSDHSTVCHTRSA